MFVVLSYTDLRTAPKKQDPTTAGKSAEIKTSNSLNTSLQHHHRNTNPLGYWRVTEKHKKPEKLSGKFLTIHLTVHRRK
jgi:hypothetical protein